MNSKFIRQEISNALEVIAKKDWPQSTHTLLATMGYQSQRILPNQTGEIDHFYALTKEPRSGTQSEDTFRHNAETIHILFQFTEHEVQEQTQIKEFDSSDENCFVFVAVLLRKEKYTRGKYAEFAREVNKRLPNIKTPVVVLFRTTTNRLTLAFVHRRPNQRNPQKVVLGSVSLIREINPDTPHRAHLDILADLSLRERLRWISSHREVKNFNGLHRAWLKALDTEELNKRFYSDLYNWYERCLSTATFPVDQTKTLHKKEHVIRLITRLMFVWFIKEKGLVAEELFNHNTMGELLINYDRLHGNSYYRAILQNLFFATLNTKIERRHFSDKSNEDHRNPLLYRYRDQIADAERLEKLFGITPFVNGGLFDCLDSFDETHTGGYRIDCFSDIPEHYNLLSIPNRLFFGDNINLGLIDIFKRYKFTVEENTPIESEVALDPELLGKVFENLLATVDPDTQKIASKETGSYYTPRPIVNYMVEEALIDTLATRVFPDNGNSQQVEEQLRKLLDYSYDFVDPCKYFSLAEQERIVRTIADLRVLDPAVGSGAFPMGILHKLTLALRRLDPHNHLWHSLQKKIARQNAVAAFDTPDSKERESEVVEISRTFDKYGNSDFGRKLYLIQNSIYGVDILPIATQIAKLRFFISLAIEQEPTNDAGNHGFKPLPNLETRFVAADTLMPLYNLQQGLISDRIRELEQELRKNRERHFHASTRSQKEELRKLDKNLRLELAAELQMQGLGSDDANKVAQWDPYDQNADATQWFDAAYMFGVEDGFDIVIGNPPYKRITKGKYPKTRFPFSEGIDRHKQNLYKMFVEQSYNLCNDGGIATLIVQKSLMCDQSSAGTRQLLLEHTQLRHIIEFPERARSRDAQVFNSVTQGTCIYQFRKVRPIGQSVKISVGNDAHTIINPRFVHIEVATIMELWPGLRCLPHVKEMDIGILRKLAGNNAVRHLQDYMARTSQGDLNLTTHKNEYSEIQTSVQLLRGEHVSRYSIRYDQAEEYCKLGFRKEKVQANQTETFLISQHVMNQQAARRLNFAMTKHPSVQFLWGNSVDKTQLKIQEWSEAFLALLNSKFLDWCFRITSSNNNVNGYELKLLPIPPLTEDDRKYLAQLANDTLDAKVADSFADTSALEKEIDQRVYALFCLTEEEIAVVEGNAAHG